jgi:hypothetical protein
MLGMDKRQALRAVAALSNDRPGWLPVLEAALVVAERCEPYGGEFAGAWVLEELKQKTGRPVWLPNLRVLITYGFLQKVGESTRGGRRAYYRFIDRETIGSVLTEHRPVERLVERQPDTRPVRFGFIGAGNSGQPGSDAARRAGDMPYQPRSWR